MFASGRVNLEKSTQTSGNSQFNSWAKHLKFAEAFRIQNVFPRRFDVGAPGAFEIDVYKGNDITKPNTICIGVIEDPTLAKGDKVNIGKPWFQQHDFITVNLEKL